MDLFKLITSETTLLTPNQRLSAALLKQFSQAQIIQQKTCWQSLDILPLSSWLKRLWDFHTAKTIAAHPILLSSNQESILWEILLRKSPASDSLLQVSATADLAMSAWELLKLWQISVDHSALSLTQDGEVFQQWAHDFKKLCEQNNWIDKNSIVNIIQTHIVEKNISLPNKIILVGFTEISPQHQSLFAQCAKLGCEVIHYQPSRAAKSIKKIGLLDEATEIRSMARWAKALYDTYPEKKPYLIGCVIPRLETLRESVLQIFSETFTVDNTFTLDHALLPFNISAGKSLLSFPIVHTAIELLKLQQKTIALETISSILRSPFLGDAENEQIKRATFESRLRNANIHAISLNYLIKPSAEYNLPAACPALAKRIKHYLQHINEYKKALPVSEWVKHFIKLLKIVGWPGERSLNSQEYQVTQRWLALLTEFSTFDTTLGSQSFAKTVDYLAELSAKTVFQPKTPEAPIQILGVLEAAELPFNHLWVMGFDDTNWPPAPKPNPLIPQHLQKSLHMPHATSERELIYCEKLMQQLQQSAGEVIFSYPTKNEEMDLRPSALLNSIIEVPQNTLILSQFASPAQKIFATRHLELLTDEQAPPIGSDEEIHGGAYIFKTQGACPFKAFAELRLHARRLETPTLGLRAIDRGNIMHKALELTWQIIKDSTALSALTEPELKNIIHDCAKQAIQLILPTASEDEIPNDKYLMLELQRVEKIMRDWLKLESTRPEFKVALQEYETKVTVGSIPVTLRVDRIDELADGSYLIIDYKTGKYNELKNWFGIRPDEPQLPLYCVISDKNTVGIAFGQIHPDDLNLIGASKKNIDIKAIKTLPEISHANATLWDEQLREWQRILENLGNDFRNGVATIDPKDINQVCNPCKLRTFCRVHEKL
jgi:ATP-dependent helicase/nuclease subunit B